MDKGQNTFIQVVDKSLRRWISGGKCTEKEEKAAFQTLGNTNI